VAIACGFVGAAGAHFANDTLLAWYTEVHGGWFKVSQAVDVLVMQPLTLVVLQGPFVVLYLLLLRRGLRGQGAGLAAGLRGEVATGLGAVTDAEVPVLLDPGRRLWLGITTLRRYGWAAYRALGRLQAAQFELGMLRWHRARGEAGEAAPDEEALRVLVGRRRAELAAVLARPPAQRSPSDPPADLPATRQPATRAPGATA
jgi:hypothetical protein